MDMQRPPRRLAAVMLADLVGYSRMVAEDEADTLARVAAVMARIARPAVARHGGRMVKGTGDGFLAEFASAVEAVACAAAIQEAMAGEARGTPPARRLLFRIGVNLGDIISGEDGDIYGDGVNLAARLEPLAEPGGIAISAKVHAEVRGRLPLAWADAGERVLKNIPDPVRVFLHAPGTRADTAAKPPPRARIAVLPFSGPAALAPGLAWLAAAAIARARRLAVTSTAEAEALARDPASLRSAAAAAGLRAVLEGEVSQAPGGAHASCLLYDPRTGEHLLALRETAAEASLPALPGRLAAAIARRAHETEPLAEAAPARSPGAMLCLLRALGAGDADAAMAALEEAVAQDPSCALAHALLAHFYSLRLAIDPAAGRDAEALATRALSLDPSDARTLALAAAALARAGSDQAAPAARLAAAAGEGDGEARAILAAAGLAGA
jgi:adenylate cyclase